MSSTNYTECKAATQIKFKFIHSLIYFVLTHWKVGNIEKKIQTLKMHNEDKQLPENSMQQLGGFIKYLAMIFVQ